MGRKFKFWEKEKKDKYDIDDVLKIVSLIIIVLIILYFYMKKKKKYSTDF